MNRFLTPIGQVTISYLSSLGAFTRLTWETICSIGKFHLGRTLHQASLLGVNSLIIVLTISLFTGMVMTYQLAHEFVKYGAQSALGGMIFISMGRELGPVLTGITVAGRVGAAITAELGSMKVTEQLDALEVMASQPVSYLVLPRLIACVCMLPILIGFSVAIGTLGGYFVSVNYTDITGQIFLDSIQLLTATDDLTAGIIKGFFFGGIIALVGCYKGIHAAPGAEGVGRATTESVVVSIMLIFICNYFLTVLLF